VVGADFFVGVSKRRFIKLMLNFNDRGEYENVDFKKTCELGHFSLGNRNICASGCACASWVGG
jgi:hypothetical protein